MAGYKPKVISMTKNPGQGFGFYLRLEQGEGGHLIRCLEMGGPAELAGLKDGERIIRVNSTFVDDLSHSQVVELIRDSGASVTFHVMDPAAYKQAKAEGADLSDRHVRPVANGIAGPAPKPKLCYLVRSTSGYGYSLRSVKGEPGLFMTQITQGGVADKAGVRANDRLLEINGVSVEDSKHEEVVETIKAAGGSVMFLLADEEACGYYQIKRIQMGAGLATVSHLPLKPRIVDLTKGSDGYGFFLKEEPKKTGHYIRDIDSRSPADRAGLRDMDRLVAVDGHCVDGCTHEEVVDRIRQSGSNCCLLVVDEETDNMYRMGRVSPMLFLEEKTSLIAPPSYKEVLQLPIHARSAAPAEEMEDDLKPKLCKMQKTTAGYGFHLNGIQGVCGQCIKEVVKDGAADKAGLEDDDIVVEVNGVNVEKSSHEQAVALIKSSGSSLELLVASSSVYERLTARGVAITPLLLRQTSSAQVHATATQEEERQQEASAEARAGPPAAPARERTPSVSSSSSMESVDERL